MLQAFIRDFWSVGSPGWAIVAGSAVKPDNENAEKKKNTGVLRPAT
jgi:hypothetical protein